jgi:DNA polymerase sigma
MVSVMQAFNELASPNGLNMRFVAFLLALVCAVLPLDISHLLSALVGAMGYLLLQVLQPKVQKSPPKKVKSAPCNIVQPPRCIKQQQTDKAMVKPQLHSPSVAPVQAPVFQGSGLDAEVGELIRQIAPTDKCEATVADITRMVKRAIWTVMPQADVAGFLMGKLNSNTAFGVAVPEVDIIISISPAEMAKKHAKNSQPRQSAADDTDYNKLLKSTIRMCTDRLVSRAGFKFRRSSFRSDEPKVTLLAPLPGDADRAVPINISVNAVIPMYNVALLTECGQLDPRSKALILLVKRWAKDRGICHAAKGHLSPYLWTLLTIYFLQVGMGDDCQFLPSLDYFVTSKRLGQKGSTSCPAATNSTKSTNLSVGSLLTAFAHFYAKEFDWKHEAVSVRSASRTQPSLTLPIHIILTDDEKGSEVGPSIEDPFDPKCNLGSCMSSSSFSRLMEEFIRADTLLSQGASLTQLLEPWVPVEQDESAQKA